MTSQNTQDTFYVDKIIDDKFSDLAIKKVSVLKDKYEEDVLNRVKVANVLKYISVLGEARPKSKFREQKKRLLKYLDFHIEKDSNQLSKKEFYGLRQEYLAPSNSIMESKGYRYRNLWIFHSLFFLGIDIFLWLLDYSRIYFYVPILFFLSLTIGIYKDLKAKRANKLLS